MRGWSAKPRIRRGQAADVDQLPTHFHGPVDGVDVVQHHLHLVVAATQRDTAAVFDELASQDDVLQMEVAGKSSEGVDRREVAARALCLSYRRKHEEPEGHEKPGVLSCPSRSSCLRG